MNNWNFFFLYQRRAGLKLKFRSFENRKSFPEKFGRRNDFQKGNLLAKKRDKAGGAGPTTPTLVGPITSPLMVKFLHLESFGRTNNCQANSTRFFSDGRTSLSAFRRPCRGLTVVGKQKAS